MDDTTATASEALTAESERALTETEPSEPAAPVPAAPAPNAPSSPTRLQRLRAWAKVKHAWARDHYGHIDPRTLGFFRIVVGFLVTTDLWRHWWEAETFYSNSGVLTNHYHLFRPSSGWNFSIFHDFSTLQEVNVAFGLATIANLCFMIGWNTRLFAFLAWMIETSMDNRLVMVENGGYVVVNLVTFYAFCLPTDRRFSVDALIRSYRERKERTIADLNDRYRPAWMTDPHVSAIVMIATINFGLVYFFNVVNKGGAIWRNGQTVFYVLYLNRMVTGIAVFFREHVPYWAMAILGWFVLMHEAFLAAWIMSPIGKRLTRPFAMVGVWFLHLVFGTFFRLGPFAWFMVGWSFILPVKENWDGLGAWYAKRASKRTLVLDRESGLAFAIARFLARIDLLELLRFEESDASDAKPALVLVRDDASGATFTGGEAVWEIVQALPGGRFARPVLKVLTLGLVGPIARWTSANRASLARFFGVAWGAKGKEHRDAPSPARVVMRRWGRHLREAFFVYMAFCFVDQIFRENKCFTPIQPWLEKVYPQPKLIQATLGYPRMYQGWGMFAPNPITDDGSVTVEAWTVDGRRIDPFTGQEPDLVLTDARGLGLGQIRQDYFNRIRLDRNKVFREGLKQYLQRWHLNTKNPNDELVAFDVYWVRAQCPPASPPWKSWHVGPFKVGPWTIPQIPLDVPSLASPPGPPQMYKNETIALLTYRRPGWKQPPGAPPIPPEPKVESAGN